MCLPIEFKANSGEQVEIDCRLEDGRQYRFPT